MGEKVWVNLVKSMDETLQKVRVKRMGEKSMGENLVKSTGENFVQSMD